MFSIPYRKLVWVAFKPITLCVPCTPSNYQAIWPNDERCLMVYRIKWPSIKVIKSWSSSLNHIIYTIYHHYIYITLYTSHYICISIYITLCIHIYIYIYIYISYFIRMYTHQIYQEIPQSNYPIIGTEITRAQKCF